MGYTHYWTFGLGIAEKAYKNALKDCRKILRNSPVPLAGGDGTGKPILRNGFMINGADSDGHETFGMPAVSSNPVAWDFCKTERKPYDVVVVACLCILHDCLGPKGFEVTSDGDPHEWEEGRTLASELLGREIKIPQTVIDQVQYYGWAARMYRKEHPEYDYTPLDESHPNHRNEYTPDYAKG